MSLAAASSSRHLPRQNDRDARDVRMLDQPPLNGAAPLQAPAPVPATPTSISNGSVHAHHPAVSPNVAPNGLAAQSAAQSSSITHKLAVANEQTWLLIGRVAEQMGDLEHALSAYENALRHNPMSLSGLTQVAGIARIKENYPKAVEYFQRVLAMQEDNGELWSALGHCYLMQDDLQKAYSAYQQALYLLPNPKEDPKLWYGIGILYDRYGSLDHAEEAFSSVLHMEKGPLKELDFDKANEILFRLGIIYKQQTKYDDSLHCFETILRNPPSPLAHADIWFQIGHVFEQQKDHVRAKDAYERVVADNPGHAKVLQQLGWLYHQDGSSFQNQELAIQYLTKSLEADPTDAQSWYLLGRAYMAGQKYNKAYEAYQQAVYRDGRNPTFWCSIGVLYFQINQFRDALDAYSRAIRINPYISEVWYDLGSLYESCNNQISDAIDAYARASELDPQNAAIARRLELLRNAQITGTHPPAAPGPQDVHPTAYASAVIPPAGLAGPPLLLSAAPSSNPANPNNPNNPNAHGARPPFRTESRGPMEPNNLGLRASSPGPFRGGPPPPVIIDESRNVSSSHTPLAPMDVDRPAREYVDRPYANAPNDRPYSTNGPPPARGQNLLLHHPVPLPTEAPNASGGGDVYLNRPLRTRTPSMSPPPPPPAFQQYRSPRVYAHEPARPVEHGPSRPVEHGPSRPGTHEPSRPVEQPGWERRYGPAEWERERERGERGRGAREYSAHASQQGYYASTRSPRDHSLSTSPREAHVRETPRPYWEAKPHPSQQSRHSPPPPPPQQHEPALRLQHEPAASRQHEPPASRRYDPRFDAREQTYEREEPRYGGSPESARGPVRGSVRGSESPRPTEQKDRRRRAPAKDNNSNKESDTQSLAGDAAPKKERKKRATKKEKEEKARADALAGGERGAMSAPYKSYKDTPETSSNGSSSNRSIQPSPTSARPPARVVDEDYDEGVADALMGLAAGTGYRGPEAASGDGGHSPTISAGSRPSPRASISHRGSVSSTRSRASPAPSSLDSLKRPHSPGADDGVETKRTRMDVMRRRESSASVGRRTPIPSTRPSPIPFRTQPASHSPEARHTQDPSTSYPASPPALPAVLPPHPRPVGTGLSGNGGPSGSVALPPIATLSPSSSAPSPAAVQEDRERERERMQVDTSRSTSPPSRSKLSEVIHPTNSNAPVNSNTNSGPVSPTAAKGTPSPASSGQVSSQMKMEL